MNIFYVRTDGVIFVSGFMSETNDKKIGLNYKKVLF